MSNKKFLFEIIDRRANLTVKRGYCDDLQGKNNFRGGKAKGVGKFEREKGFLRKKALVFMPGPFF